MPLLAKHINKIIFPLDGDATWLKSLPPQDMNRNIGMTDDIEVYLSYNNLNSNCTISPTYRTRNASKMLYKSGNI